MDRASRRNDRTAHGQPKGTNHRVGATVAERPPSSTPPRLPSVDVLLADVATVLERKAGDAGIDSLLGHGYENMDGEPIALPYLQVEVMRELTVALIDHAKALRESR